MATTQLTILAVTILIFWHAIFWYNLFVLSRKVSAIIGRKMSLDPRSVVLFINLTGILLENAEDVSARNYFDGSYNKDAAAVYVKQRVHCYAELIIVTLLAVLVLAP